MDLDKFTRAVHICLERVTNGESPDYTFAGCYLSMYDDGGNILSTTWITDTVAVTISTSLDIPIKLLPGGRKTS